MDYLKCLKDYLQISTHLLEKLCATLGITHDQHLFDHLLARQEELCALCLDEKWKVRLHGEDIAFISAPTVIQVNLSNTHLITMSFFHAYLKSQETQDSPRETQAFFDNLVQQGQAIPMEPLNGYHYLIML